MTVTWAVGASGWTQGLNVITFVGLGAILIGMMLARSILPALVAHLFSLIIGIGWSFWVTTRLLPAHYTWLERWEDLALRLSSWYTQAMQGGTSYDNLMFIFQMGVIVWCVGYLTVWFVFRSLKVWQAIVPGGVVLLMNLYYAPSDITFWFLIYLLISLLLVIRFNVLTQEAKWRAEGTFFRPDVGFDFLRDGFIFSALIIGIAWITPPLFDSKALGLLDEFQGNWQSVQGEWNRLYADLNYRDQTGAVGTFGQSFTLGGPRYLTDEPVMDVRVEGRGRYWRATVYDYYNGIGWRSTSQDSAPFGPTNEVPLPTFAARQLVTQTYTLYRDNSTVLYAMANVVDLDRSARVNFNTISEAEASAVPLSWSAAEGPIAEEITYIRSNAAVDGGESYQVVSAASQASVNQLRQSGTNYPDWVTARYLQLPTITDRTRQLAEEITAAYDTPFDKAQAIERYLRNNIRYNEAIELPPTGVNKVDYILFDLQEAYCDYYATSMIVMLRSLGIPARMAAGFARGQFQVEQATFHVINADAHSWVEVYFPRYGWVEFEPTAAQPNILRPTGPAENSDPFSNVLPDTDFPDGRNLEDLEQPNNIPIDEENFVGPGLGLNFSWLGGEINVSGSTIGGGFALILLLIGAVLGLGWLWWRRQQSRAAQSIFNLYEGMLTLARWMGATLYSWQTPYEQAAALKERLPTYEREVDTITNDYVHHTFSPPPPTGHIIEKGSGPITLTHDSSDAWQRLRPEMVKLILRRLMPWNWKN